MVIKNCIRCGQLKPITAFGYRRRYCKECAEPLDGCGRAKLKAEVVSAYGGACACCGERTPEFLAVDHIHNDGAAHRREVKSGSLYGWLKRNGFPKDRFQLLCHNCNAAKALYGACPHSLRHRRRAA